MGMNGCIDVCLCVRTYGYEFVSSCVCVVSFRVVFSTRNHRRNFRCACVFSTRNLVSIYLTLPRSRVLYSLSRLPSFLPSPNSGCAEAARPDAQHRLVVSPCSSQLWACPLRRSIGRRRGCARSRSGGRRSGSRPSSCSAPLASRRRRCRSRTSRARCRHSLPNVPVL